MTMMNSASSWHVGKPGERCAGCGVELLPEMACWAALCDGGAPVRAAMVEEKKKKETKDKDKEKEAEVSPFVRIDFCEACWAAGKRPENIVLPPLPSGPGAEGGGDAASVPRK